MQLKLLSGLIAHRHQKTSHLGGTAVEADYIRHKTCILHGGQFKTYGFARRLQTRIVVSQKLHALVLVLEEEELAQESFVFPEEGEEEDGKEE